MMTIHTVRVAGVIRRQWKRTISNPKKLDQNEVGKGIIDAK